MTFWENVSNIAHYEIYKMKLLFILYHKNNEKSFFFHLLKNNTKSYEQSDQEGRIAVFFCSFMNISTYLFPCVCMFWRSWKE